MSEENKYVTHSQLHKRDLELYRYVDTSYKELEVLYYKLDKKLDLDRQKSEYTIEQQKEMITGIKQINDNFVTFDKRVSKIEDKTDSNVAQIEKISKNIKEKRDGMFGLLGTIITACGGIIVAAIGFAQIFF